MEEKGDDDDDNERCGTAESPVSASPDGGTLVRPVVVVVVVSVPVVTLAFSPLTSITFTAATVEPLDFPLPGKFDNDEPPMVQFCAS